jgi:hypothetical protein
MRWLLGVLGLALIAVVAWIVSQPTPSTPEGAASPPSVSVPAPKSRFADSDFAALKAKYGQPDEDDSTAYDNPRPPLVTRWLIYNKQRLRFMFLADGKVGDPPPYSRWASNIALR